MSFRPIDHTADVAVEVTAPSTAQLFAEAARALTDTITSVAAIEPRQDLAVELAADRLERLLVDFLEELLFRFETGGFLPSGALVDLEEVDGGWKLASRLRGEPYDGDRHPFRTAVKGITLHGLDIQQLADRTWRAQIVLDV